ncbi:glycosyltransferase family 2 protein [Nocardioides aurantiacus]|uniref:GT2 family glycosyltransferase n=1 Tax=Nocardioides aurantiacus TaxID=86796 RepID=A0A3N2CVI3_9ACTN|nr:galactosyltransferase-related protein [Nocardioides aurantiacus]ROR91562.1 GT2 family glycosyltransferase [Nocardioides aurantiacus]
MTPPARATAGDVAVITLVRGRREHLARQQRSLSRGTVRPAQWVVVAMDDPGLADFAPRDGVRPTVVHLDADPRGLPLAAARNAGAERALAAGARVLVFLDVDCLAGPHLVSAYDAAVTDDPDVVWSGPVTYLPEGLDEEQLATPWTLDSPHPARAMPPPGQRLLGAPPELFWSLSFALSARAWTATGGFCEDYVGYGGEDTDFGMLVVDRGLEHGWLGDARAYHQHHPTSSPPVQHLEAVVRNGAVFADRWGWWPMSGWLEAFEERGLVEREGDGWRLARDDRPDSRPDSRVDSRAT